MELTHIGQDGNAKMVDVSLKPVTKRTAVASGHIYFSQGTIEKIKKGSLAKGNVLNTAKVAGIMAAKNTAGIIPMCHTLPLDGVDIEFVFQDKSIEIISTITLYARTGVEMEALTSVSVAALTIYDMVKAIDKKMVIGDIKLIKKTGGKTDINTKDEVPWQISTPNIKCEIDTQNDIPWQVSTQKDKCEKDTQNGESWQMTISDVKLGDDSNNELPW